MTYDPAKHHRRSIRLTGYGYTQPGLYFVTICVREQECALGRIVNGEMELSAVGQIAAESWQWLAEQYPYVTLDAWVIMPNHMHGIIVIDDPIDHHTDDHRRGDSRIAPTDTTPPAVPPRIAPTDTAPPAVAATVIKRKPLGRLIGAFKTASTKRINQTRGTPGQPFWQRNYHERIIRDERALNHIRRYIHHNPSRWAADTENPDR